uniref:Ribosomal RNA small subunit methyltransferase G n=1 Tax=Candidatus Kentrum sp. LPFa TaxID=2126335 RepID=A0A450X0Q9_9GAMM|nr:MAG: 16S rRNA m(7)G-527 methyltransferase [Candidatus Kentron sp. LPFa]
MTAFLVYQCLDALSARGEASLVDRNITTDRILQLLERGVARTDLALEEKAYDALVRYVGLLMRWNRAYNLTSIRDPVEIARRHVLDCLVILPYLRGTRLLDLGTGAGLPGIVLAIARPDIECVLLDGTGKKTRFCTQVATEIGLSNVAVRHMRVEEYAPETLFTTITARAFGPLSVLQRQAGRLLAEGGRLLAMKGTMKGIIKEISDVEALAKGAGKDTSNPGGLEIVALDVPDLAAERHLVIVERR